MPFRYRTRVPSCAHIPKGKQASKRQEDKSFFISPSLPVSKEVWVETTKEKTKKKHERKKKKIESSRKKEARKKDRKKKEINKEKQQETTQK